MKRLTHKTIIRHLRRVLRESDIVIEIIDARYPEETRNRWIEWRAGWGRLIIAVNKTDLVTAKELGRISSVLKKIGIPYVFVSCKQKKGATSLKNKLFDMINKNKKIRKLKRIKVGIVGYPDVGKSSLINMLTKARHVKVSAKPGTTRGKQYIRLTDRILLIDTPGIFPKGRRLDDLALYSAFDVDRLDDPFSVASYLIQQLITDSKYKKLGKQLLEKFYNVKLTTDKPDEIIELIAYRRKMLLKGGKPNVYQISKTILRDWQKGALLAHRKQG